VQQGRGNALRIDGTIEARGEVIRDDDDDDPNKKGSEPMNKES